MVAMGRITATESPMGGGPLIRVDLATGAIDPHYFDAPLRVGTYAQGIDGSPAVLRDRVYISNVPGTVHCLHKSDVSLIWTTSLNTANQAANQPMGQSQCGLLAESARGG